MVPQTKPLLRISRLVVALAVLSGCSASTRSGEEPKTATVHETATSEQLELGLAFASAGDRQRAIQYLGAALKAGADPNRGFEPLFRSCVEDRQYEAALIFGEAYVDQLANPVGPRLWIAGLYLSLDQPKAAAAHLEWLVAHHPDEALPHFLMAEVYGGEYRDATRADEQYRTYLSLAPNGRYASKARQNLLVPISASPHDL